MDLPLCESGHWSHWATILDPALISQFRTPVPAVALPQATIGLLKSVNPIDQHRSSLILVEPSWKKSRGSTEELTIAQVVGRSVGGWGVARRVGGRPSRVGDIIDDPVGDESVGRGFLGEEQSPDSGEKLDLGISLHFS